MPAQIDNLLHALANRMQAAAAGAALLHLAGSVPDPHAAELLQQLIDELQEATSILQAMRRECEGAQPRKKSAAG